MCIKNKKKQFQAHLLVSPLAEVDGVRGQTELLAHSPLEVHRLGLQRAVLGQVTAGNTHSHSITHDGGERQSSRLTGIRRRLFDIWLQKRELTITAYFYLKAADTSDGDIF